MKLTSFAAAALAAAAIGGGVIAFSGERQIASPLPAQPAAPQIQPIELIEATPFRLVEAHTHHYRAEAPRYDAGTLLVLRMAPELLVPRQTFENVLYVGAETAERVNVGDRSGFLVALVPGTPDLSTTPIFWGQPELPERVTAAEAQRQLDLARSAGVTAPGAAAAQGAAREAVELYDSYELLRFASYAVERFSPQEQDLIGGLRAPRIGG
jgi:hypothetical protein